MSQFVEDVFIVLGYLLGGANGSPKPTRQTQTPDMRGWGHFLGPTPPQTPRDNISKHGLEKGAAPARMVLQRGGGANAENWPWKGAFPAGSNNEPV